MSTGVSTTEPDYSNWVLKFNPPTHPIESGPNYVTVYQTDSTLPHGGEGALFANLAPFTDLPNGATITKVTLTITVASDGSSEFPPVVHPSPNICFDTRSEMEAGSFPIGFGHLGTSNEGTYACLPFDTAPHTIVYDSDTYPDISGGGGWYNLPGLIGGIQNPDNPMCIQLSVSNLEDGGYIRYDYPIVLSAFWEAAPPPVTGHLTGALTDARVRFD